MSKGKAKSKGFRISLDGALMLLALWFSWHHNWLALVAVVAIYWLVRYR